MKLCKDCKQQKGSGCDHGYLSPISGNEILLNAKNARESELYCGMEAKYFEPKEEEPKEFTGPTCEMTPDLEDAFRESCEKLVMDEGACSGIRCDNCVGDTTHNSGKHCTINGFSIPREEPSAKDHIIVANAKKWLADHPKQYTYAQALEMVLHEGKVMRYAGSVPGTDTMKCLGSFLVNGDGVSKFITCADDLDNMWVEVTE